MGTREFTDENERTRRRNLVEKVGERVWGASWQTPMAEALGIPRARVSQWMLVPSDKKEKNLPAKPVPMRVMEALPAIARYGAERLRRHADELDALAAEMEDGGAPPAEGEPDAPGEPPIESGPAAAAESAYDDGSDFDMDALVEAFADKRLPRPTPEAAPEPEPPAGWRSRFAEEHAARWAPRNV